MFNIHFSNSYLNLHILCHKLNLLYFRNYDFLSDPGVPEVLMSLHPRPCADLTDVTLADEDINSTPAGDVNSRAGPPSQKWSDQQITVNPTGSIHKKARGKKFDPKKVNFDEGVLT